MGFIQKTCLVFILIAGLSLGINAQKKQLEQEILNHGAVIRKAFMDEDLDKIAALHHPEVTKAIGYNNVQNGRDAVMDGLRETLKRFRLEFVENTVESLFVQNNLVIEQSKFVIRGTPKQEGEPFNFAGRTMVTYIRYDDSPTGWATIREIIQPSTD